MKTIRNTSVQHVGIGVNDIEASKAFYRYVLRCTKQYADFGRVRNVMPDFFRTSPHVLDGWMYHQELDGIAFECVQRHEPSPRPIHKQIRFGDIGVNKQTIEVTDVRTLAREYKDKMKFLGEPGGHDDPRMGRLQLRLRRQSGRQPAGVHLEPEDPYAGQDPLGRVECDRSRAVDEFLSALCRLRHRRHGAPRRFLGSRGGGFGE